MGKIESIIESSSNIYHDPKTGIDSKIPPVCYIPKTSEVTVRQPLIGVEEKSPVQQEGSLRGK